MQNSLGQFHQQILKQTLSTQQIQFVKLLAMSTSELNDYLNEIQAENPIVDVAAVTPSFQPPQATSSIDMVKWIKEKTVNRQPQDVSDESEREESYSAQSFNDERYNIEEHLKSQLDLSLTDIDLSLMEKIIASIDKNGYLTVTAEQLSKGGIDYELAAEAITYLKTLEPPGIGAVDLRECLTLQLVRLGVCDHIAFELIENHLEDLSHGYFQKIAKLLRCETSKVKDIYKTIRGLNPRPAAGFGSESLTYILPDVTIVESEEGLSISYNKHYSASLSINDNYLSIAKQSDDAKAYINKKLSQALWVLKAVESRQNTIERIVAIIIRHHASFFNSADRTLSPLRLKDVAKLMDVHESTVSRAINEKYLECKKGIFPLKYFFASALFSVDNIASSISSRSVKEFIKDIISQEDKVRPLSDNSIATMLSDEGMPLARRTVAKYREELGLPSSSIRKA